MWNVEQVNTMVDKLSQEVENALGDVILFGYSFGGIIARLGYQKLSELDTRKVKVIVTMGTPHQIPSKRQRKFVEGTLGLKQSVNILILALTGYLDPFAMPLFAKLPGSNIKTKSLWCTHSGFFYSKNTRNKVVKEMKLFFSENSIL